VATIAYANPPMNTFRRVFLMGGGGWFTRPCRLDKPVARTEKALWKLCCSRSSTV
jgi:hypothetical protein